MRLIDAISQIADHARQYRLPMPHILMPAWAVHRIAQCIEEDIGGTLYFPGQPVQFDGVTFAPLTAKPRIRVKAGRRVYGGVRPSDYLRPIHRRTINRTVPLW